MVLYEKSDQLYVLKLTSNWGYYSSNTDDFIEFAVDSPDKFTYFPLPKLGNYAYSFKFHAYNGYAILIANRNSGSIVMGRIKYQFFNPFDQSKGCLLYTSDAADDTPCVDLGGRRIIKKKKKNRNS
eukprot:TRINITY_DN2830_c0_g1_i2.p1 TRINITY_DN2830_c0_g1~~TRINITY_DN2830_c0_g1_i2.p1  ORF type:complete len:126 (+),score=25.70 TRINITY_DN2830_c0_g1_i2:230-607(+)